MVRMMRVAALLWITVVGMGGMLRAAGAEARGAAESVTPVPTPIPTRNYQTAPADLPAVGVERWPGETGDGYLFISLYSMGAAPARYNLILDDDGEPVYYESQAANRYDFKLQPDGRLTYFTTAGGEAAFVALDDGYRIVREIKAGRDPETGETYRIDLHDLQVLENGHALLLIHDVRTVDMSGLAPGGSEEAAVVGCTIQEIDNHNRVVFQWQSWDHFAISDTYEPLTNNPLRYVHCNSIEEDSDGNLLLSSKNLHEITKIDRQTGAIIWRMGGRHNEFTFVNDTGFTVQHDARRLENGRLTVYDNADFERQPSRGVEYQVDELNRRVVKTTEFLKTPAPYGWSMGNMQRLPNGNTLIGWGSSSEPVLTEFDADGRRILELKTNDRMVSYRAFRFPWHGYPSGAPDLIARVEGDVAHLFFSWNGSTETVAYMVNGGRTPQELAPLTWVRRDGFESTFSYELPQDGLFYFKVRPIDGDGTAGPPSNMVVVTVGGDRSYLPAAMR